MSDSFTPIEQEYVRILVAKIKIYRDVSNNAQLFSWATELKSSIDEMASLCNLHLSNDAKLFFYMDSPILEEFLHVVDM